MGEVYYFLLKSLRYLCLKIILIIEVGTKVTLQNVCAVSICLMCHQFELACHRFKLVCT